MPQLPIWMVDTIPGICLMTLFWNPHPWIMLETGLDSFFTFYIICAPFILYSFVTRELFVFVSITHASYFREPTLLNQQLLKRTDYSISLLYKKVNTCLPKRGRHQSFLVLDLKYTVNNTKAGKRLNTRLLVISHTSRAARQVIILQERLSGRVVLWLIV
jgi:hypothetical protein